MVSKHLLPSARLFTLKPARCLAIAVILLSALMVTDILYAAGRQRFDDFESYPLGQLSLPTANGYWRSDSGRIPPDIVSSAADAGVGPHSGSKMARFNYDTTLAWPSLNIFSSMQSANTSSIIVNDEFFYRMWVRHDANCGRVDLGSGKKFMRIYSGNGAQSNDLITDFITSNGFTNFGNDSGGAALMPTYWGGSGDFSATNSVTQWVKVEYYFKFSTGTVKVWTDGALRRNDTGRNLTFWGTHGDGWKDFYPQSNWGDVENNGYRHGTTNYMYVEDFEVYSDVGTGATGLMSDATITQVGSTDTTPPVAPVNLRIQ